MKIWVFLVATVLIFAVSWALATFVLSLGEPSPYANELPLVIQKAERLGLERPAQVTLCILDFGIYIPMVIAGKKDGGSGSNAEFVLITFFSSAVWGYIIARTIAFLKKQKRPLS